MLIDATCGQKSFYHSNDTNKSLTKIWGKTRQIYGWFLVHALALGCIGQGGFIYELDIQTYLGFA